MHNESIKCMVDHAMSHNYAWGLLNDKGCAFYVSHWQCADCLECNRAVTAYEVCLVRERYTDMCTGCPWVIKCLSIPRAEGKAYYKSRWMVRLCSHCSGASVTDKW